MAHGSDGGTLGKRAFRCEAVRLLKAVNKEMWDDEDMSSKAFLFYKQSGRNLVKY